MNHSAYQLAQVNVALLREPIDSPALAGFVAALEPIHVLADVSPGFVWRLQTEDGDATAIRPFDDDRMIVNLSVWASIQALADFTYRSGHTAVMRGRRAWFHQMREAFVALWWVPSGERPTVEDAKERLEHLRTHGPTAHAFTIQSPHEAPGTLVQPMVREDDVCPA